jgi:hypothetical protein
MAAKTKLIGGAIASMVVIGIGGFFILDSWLDKKAKTEVETQLTEAAGTVAGVGQADVQLLRQRVSLQNIELANLPEFSSTNLLTIQSVVIDKPSLNQPQKHVQAIAIEGIQINIDGNLNSMPQLLASQGLPNLNIAKISQQIEQHSQAQTQNNANGGSNGGDITFTIDELKISPIAVVINLEVPWQTETLNHTINIPATTLTNVTNENIGEQFMTALGEPILTELQAFALEEILPKAMAELQKSIPAEIDLSDIQLPEGVDLPDSIQLPKIKLP